MRVRGGLLKHLVTVCHYRSSSHNDQADQGISHALFWYRIRVCTLESEAVTAMNKPVGLPFRFNRVA